MNRPMTLGQTTRRLTFTLCAALASGLAAADYQADVEAWTIDAPPAQQSVVIRGATLWTAGEAGILEEADLRIEDGRIVGVGADLAAVGAVPDRTGPLCRRALVAGGRRGGGAGRARAAAGRLTRFRHPAGRGGRR